MEKIDRLVNKLLGIISMYYGMLLGLLSIWFVALVLSIFGQLHFNPLSMIVSLIVLVVSVGLSSWLCGALFGVRAYGLSSMITGVILALIFSPTLEIGGLLVLALIGLIAGASKYVLAYKGRHIFNPAAVAAVIIGLTGLGSATWWVATPALALIVLATIIVSLYKSKQYSIFFSFLVVAASLLVIVFVANGVSLADTPLLLLSWPLLFFGGVMLTEPLTLPPRKWQLYTEGIIVAVLFAIPLQVGGFQMNPETALIIGNIFAAVVAGRRAIALTFKERRKLTPTTDELVFVPSVPVQFTPGQYMELTLPHGKADLRGERRSFSLTSLPNTNEVTFGIKFYDPSSTFKKALKKLEPGVVLTTSNLSGDFVLPTDASKPLLFIAGGIGITPFISQLKAIKKNNQNRDVVLLYAVSDASEIAYKKVLTEAGITVVVFTKEPLKDLPKNWKQSKSARITEESIAQLVPDVSQRNAYISGPPSFVYVTKRALRSLKATAIKTDYFVGY